MRLMKDEDQSTGFTLFALLFTAMMLKTNRIFFGLPEPIVGCQEGN
jgi:hypothetical protein